MDKLIRELRAVDWSDVHRIGSRTLPALDSIIEKPGMLASMTLDALSDQTLLSLGEHLPWANKFVLYEDERGFRIRLHVFLPGYRDRPHSHRFAFSSYIVRGGYRHEFWGQEPGPDVDLQKFRPNLLAIRNESRGCSYTLGDTILHCFTAEPSTISLVIRGPATKERNINIDPERGIVKWKYGADKEPPEARKEVEILPEHIDYSLGVMDREGLL